MADEWVIEYYVEDNGRVPVREILQSVDKETYARFLWSLEQVRVRNIMAREPLARHIEGKIWEIREESHTNIYRILYFFSSGKRIILLHGFTKKTQKLPGKELEMAMKRLARFIERESR
jgi:phage-related protein